MRDLFKSVPARIKAITDADQPGTFEALVSVFGVIDADGEVVMPGAFTKTLAASKKAIVFSHQWGEVPVGQTLTAVETSDGLLVKGRLFVGPEEDHAKAREVYAAMRGGALTEFSWGGKVTSETIVKGENGAPDRVELNEVDLVEYGPCLRGVNPETRLQAVKSLASAGLLTGDEARVAIGVAAKSEADAPAADPPAVDSAVAPLGDDSDTNGEDVDTDGPKLVTPADDGWSSTLAAVRAGVLTTAEARERLGLPALPAADAPTPAPSADAPAADGAPTASSPLARTLAALRLAA